MTVFDAKTLERFEIGLYEGVSVGRRIKIYKTPLIFGAEGRHGGYLYCDDAVGRYRGGPEACDFFGLDYSFAFQAWDTYTEALAAMVRSSPLFTTTELAASSQQGKGQAAPSPPSPKTHETPARPSSQPAPSL